MSTDYAALANTIKIEDITSDEINRDILQKLKYDYDDESFDYLYIMDSSGSSDEDEYIPDEGEDLGWLGYYIGQNTKLQVLNFYKTINNESFYKEICRNVSIKEIRFSQISLDGEVLSMLDPFFQNNHNLTRFTIDECEFGVEGARHLSLAIGNCNKSLTHIEITNNEMEDVQLVGIIITNLSIHPQLQELDLSDNGISMGRNECTALSTLLRTTTQLETLNLNSNNIDDEGMGLLLPALRGHSLQKLSLGSNRSITLNGWKAIASLLEMPKCNLKELYIHNNNLGDEGALVFAEALTNNSTLETLSSIGITPEGWAPFEKLLCDTTAVNNTYLSNHTLTHLGDPEGDRSCVNASLAANRIEDKQQVAMIKILKHHSHFNMQPFFEWEFKVLPIMVSWFAKAATCLDASFEDKINKMKLSVIYDFVKEFPMLCIEPITRKEIVEYTALEKELQGGELEEIRQRKVRAWRRL